VRCGKIRIGFAKPLLDPFGFAVMQRIIKRLLENNRRLLLAGGSAQA
jgi:hypothetical protein